MPSVEEDEKRKARALERLTLLRRQEKEEMAFRAKVVEEEETRRRVEEGVACRLEQELERRSEEIESEVERRVAAAKLEMEAAMLKEVENMRCKHLQEEIDKEEAERARSLEVERILKENAAKLEEQRRRMVKENE